MFEALKQNKTETVNSAGQNGKQTFFKPANHVQQENRTVTDKQISMPDSSKAFFKSGNVTPLLNENINRQSINSNEFKTKLSAGGIAGLALDATFSTTSTPCDTLQIIQVFWGTPHNALGKDKKIGDYTFTQDKKQYDAFVDGGIKSPWVTLSGNPPADATNPYYLTATEHAAQVNFAKDTGTIRTTDMPGAVAYYDEAYFETGVVAVNYQGKKTDKVLTVFKWGWKNQGADPIHGKGMKLGGTDTGITLNNSFSSTAKKIISNDYPGYKYS